VVVAAGWGGMAFSQQAPVVMVSGLDASHRPGMTESVIASAAKQSIARQAEAWMASSRRAKAVWCRAALSHVVPLDLRHGFVVSAGRCRLNG